MAQWKVVEDMMKTEKIPKSQILSIYSNRRHFSIMLRAKYATWIESQNWDEYTKAENIQSEGKNKFDEFVQLVEDNCQDESVVHRLTNLSAIEDFKQHYEGNYEEFIKLMIHILHSEQILIQSTMEDVSEDRHFDIAHENKQIAEDLKNFRLLLRASEAILKNLEITQEKKWSELNDIHGKSNKLKKQPSVTQPVELNKLQKLEYTIINELSNLRKKAVAEMEVVCDQMYQILDASWKDLKQWKREQRLACTMLCKPKEGIMEVLDTLFENVAAVFNEALCQVDQLVTILRQSPVNDETLLKQAMDMSRKMDEWLLKHLNKVFLVDKNIPKQVLKLTNGKSLAFSMSVRLLGGYALGLHANVPKVMVNLYSEKQLNEVMSADDEVPSSIKIQNARNKPFQFMRQGNCLASFNHMVVSGVKREGKGRGDDFVTDYKHAFVFFTVVKIHDKEIRLKAMSLPIVVTSQTSQECMARGTIIWCSAFRKPKAMRRLPFEAEEEVKWPEFTKVLNALFKEYTGRTLTDDNLYFLAVKAFRAEGLNFNSLTRSQKSIFKDKMPTCDFPFWKWFMACLNSVKDMVKNEWKEGLIYGFISKQKAEEILHPMKPGTFLIRFSESVIEQAQRADIHGYLTVAFNEIHPDTAQTMVFHTMESLSPKDLSEKSLAPILDAYQIENPREGVKKLLRTLWTPKGLYSFDDVFGKFIKEKEKKNDGYKQGRYVVEIYLTERSGHRNSQLPPQSPMFMQAQSPAESEYSSINSPSSELFRMCSDVSMTEPQQQLQQHQQQHEQPHETNVPVACISPFMPNSDIYNNPLSDMQFITTLLEDQNLLTTTPDGDVMLNETMANLN